MLMSNAALFGCTLESINSHLETLI